MNNQNSTERSESDKARRSIKEIAQITVMITVAIICVMFALLICISMYTKGLTVESILSMLLAFFSIFISIFFYFKADETSNKFYDSSYEFMKEQSVLLGRIEERFGEKFENLFSRLDHLNVGQAEKESELTGKTEEISDIVRKLILTISANDQAAQNHEFMATVRQYGSELEAKRAEYDELADNLREMRKEAQITANRINSMRSMMPQPTYLLRFVTELGKGNLSYLLRCNGRIQRSNPAYKIARKYSLCDEEGIMSSELKEFLDEIRRDIQY